jgi:predicted MFS family arabinose efflux permease
MSTVTTTTPPSTAPSSTRSPAPASTEPHRRRHGRGFWAITAVFASTMAFAGAPAPLYVLYQQREGFSSFAITLIFAAYAAGVVASLFTAGHLSDRFGRRRLIAPAVLLNVLAALIFIAWPQLPGLLLARFVSGLGIGMLTASATAHLTELHTTAHPVKGTRRAEVVSTAANIGGIGLGPLVAGALAEFAPDPLYTPYMVFAFILVIGVLLVVVVPETVAGVDSSWTYRPQRVAVPRAARGRYLAATMLAFVGFAMFGLFTSLAPSFVSGRLGITSHLVAGVVAFTVFAASAVFQVLSSRWAPARQTGIGLVLLGAGLAMVVVAIVGGSLALLIAGGAVAGAGVGTTFKAAIGTVVALAPAETRGEALAGLFLVGYLGMAVPVMMLGLALQFMPMAPAVLGFGAIMLALLAATAVTLARTSRAPR